MGPCSPALEFSLVRVSAAGGFDTVLPMLADGSSFCVLPVLAGESDTVLPMLADGSSFCVLPVLADASPFFMFSGKNLFSLPVCSEGAWYFSQARQ